MNNVERYMKRQEQLHRVDRWLEENARWGWLMAALLAGFVLSVAWVVRAVLDHIGGGQ